MCLDKKLMIWELLLGDEDFGVLPGSTKNSIWEK